MKKQELPMFVAQRRVDEGFVVKAGDRVLMMIQIHRCEHGRARVALYADEEIRFERAGGPGEPEFDEAAELSDAS